MNCGMAVGFARKMVFEIRWTPGLVADGGEAQVGRGAIVWPCGALARRASFAFWR